MNDITISDLLGDETIHVLGEVCNEFEKILLSIIKSKGITLAILASSLITSLIQNQNLNHVNQMNEVFLTNNNTKDLPELTKEITLCLEKMLYFSNMLEKALVAYSVEEIMETYNTKKEENKTIN